MQITILDKNFQNVGVIKNGNPYTPSFFGDTWHRYLAEGASTFDFTVNKYIDGELQDYCRYINEKAYFHFRYEGKDYLFYVMTITEDDFVIQLSCNSLNLELQNEYANPFTSTSAQSFEWYFKQMEFYFAELELGINEVSDAKLTLTFESQETKLERLRSLLNKFDAEFEFVTKLSDDYSFNKLVLNVYKARDDNHQGVGKIRSDISLHYGKNIKGVQRVVDKTQLFNAGKFIGADGLTVRDIERSDKNKNGVEEFYTRKGNVMVYAPLSMADYPSHTRKNGVDQWTRKDFQTEYTNVNELVAYAFRTLKKYAYPIVTYTINAFSNWLDISAVNLGDTVMIHDKNFVDGLNLSARVIEQVISFSNPKNNQLTFSNVVQLESELSQGIRERLKQMVEDAQPYVVTIATDTGVNFKNNKGQSVVSPTLTKGNKIIDCGWRYVVDGVIKSTSPTYIVRGSDVSDKLVLTIGAWVDNQEVASTQVTFININDGKNGSNGERGEDGKSLRLFTTQYKYAQKFINQYSADDYTGDWSVIENTAGLKVGDSVQIRVFNTDKQCDSWIVALVSAILGENRIKTVSKGLIEKGDKGERGTQGERGLQGIQGLQGPKGDQGIPGIKGSDGRTQYTHFAYADDANGRGFSQTDQNKAYIGMYQDFVAADSTDPTKYRWGKMRGPDGPQGIPGKPGVDGKTPYIHFAYAESADGRHGFSITQTGNKRYIGTYTDYTQADSTDPTKYKWVDMVGSVEVGGRNLLRNSAGPFKPDKKPSDYDNCEYYPKSTIDMVNGKQYILTAETDGVITNLHDGSINNENVVIWLASLDYKIHSIISDGKTDKSGTVFTWAYPTGTYMIRVNTYKKVSDKSVWKIKIAEGNTKSGWSPAPEDVEDNINSKADNALTQEQLNALNEKNSIMQAELEAKASLDMVNQWFKAYQDFVKSNAVDKAKSEKDLIAATQRVAKIENNLGDMAQRWNFIDTYMQATNEGLSIGKKDGSSFVRMGDNRISFYSAGKEVAYFSGGALQVDNGIFTKTLQIGRFREEQYHLNPDMNVIRYVGGA